MMQVGASASNSNSKPALVPPAVPKKPSFASVNSVSPPLPPRLPSYGIAPTEEIEVLQVGASASNSNSNSKPALVPPPLPKKPSFVKVQSVGASASNSNSNSKPALFPPPLPKKPQSVGAFASNSNSNSNSKPALAPTFVPTPALPKEPSVVAEHSDSWTLSRDTLYRHDLGDFGAAEETGTIRVGESASNSNSNSKPALVPTLAPTPALPKVPSFDSLHSISPISLLDTSFEQDFESGAAEETEAIRVGESASNSNSNSEPALAPTLVPPALPKEPSVVAEHSDSRTLSHKAIVFFVLDPAEDAKAMQVGASASNSISKPALVPPALPKKPSFALLHFESRTVSQETLFLYDLRPAEETKVMQVGAAASNSNSDFKQAPNTPPSPPALNTAGRRLFSDGVQVIARPVPAIFPVWNCSRCDTGNPISRANCDLCGTERPEDCHAPLNGIHMNDLCIPDLKIIHESLQKMLAEAKDQVISSDLIAADNQPLVFTDKKFDCPICFATINPGEGVRLNSCLHEFCTECLRDHIAASDTAIIACPFANDTYKCNEPILDREIETLVGVEGLEKFKQRGLQQFEAAAAANSFHCKTIDCKGFCLLEDVQGIDVFECPVCKARNCLRCKAIHVGMDCKQYQEDVKARAERDEAARATQLMLEKEIEDGNAMRCPQCNVVVTKTEGCDWLQCKMCQCEICWATKGPRWGPKGKGDTSGGCRCRFNDGQRCAPNCGYCH